MEIRPVDMQLFVNKSADVNKINDQSQQNMESQQLFSEEFAKTTERENQSTVNSQKSEDRNIADDGSGGGNKSGNRRNRKRKSVEEEEKVKKKLGGSIFDVSI